MSEAQITPMPLEGAGKPDVAPRPPFLLLFGGTFDPPHAGHVELPVRVRDELERQAGCAGAAWLVYVPAARSPHKQRGPAAKDADRVEMLRLALEGVPRACIWTDEIDRASRMSGDDPSYTLDTLRRARGWLDANGMSETELRLLIGADQAVSFDRWRGPREIIAIARPAVMVRGDVADADDLVRRLRQTRFWRKEDLERWRDGMVSVGRLDVSATRVREALRGGDREEIGRWLAPNVARYIRERGLYGETSPEEEPAGS